ncbi:P63C domain-containing protein [Weissella confusa]|uniref:p63C domain protein n=1 Tax=Weissella cibaria TaxID=137591 RepID=A0A0D1K8J4_9LACO|nr:P63C domain-containing protein [Weissella cibaria]KIU21334.1 P63C domain protein [Weissella cibaria]
MSENIEELTHTGYIEIGEVQMYSIVTKSGKRLIRATDVFNAVGKSRRGNVRVDGYPAFIGARNIVQFIDDDLRSKIQPVKYRAKNGKISIAYDATIIPEIADLYIEAHDKGVLTESQYSVYERSLIIVRSLAKLGITALIDEATGYQDDRETHALQKLLQAYISEDLMKWQKRFPTEFYREVYRLYGLEFDPNNPKRPQWIGNFTLKYVYGVFPEKVMDEIRSRNPKIETPRKTVYRGHKHFQHLTEEIGIPQLDNQLKQLIVVMRISNDITEFEKNFYKVFARELEHKAIVDDTKKGLINLFDEVN